MYPCTPRLVLLGRLELHSFEKVLTKINMYKKIVLAGGCFWVRNGMGPISLQEYFLFWRAKQCRADLASNFVSEAKQSSDKVYSSRREKTDNYIYYV